MHLCASLPAPGLQPLQRDASLSSRSLCGASDAWPAKHSPSSDDPMQGKALYMPCQVMVKHCSAQSCGCHWRTRLRHLGWYW